MNVVLLIICLLLTVLYVVLMNAYRAGFEMQADHTIPSFVDDEGRTHVFEPSVFISVIVPARNEEKNIADRINSILRQEYPVDLMEVIVVDDHSEDDTAAIVQQMTDERVKYVRLADHIAPGQKVNAYKKAALAAGIAASRGELIVTTDADCYSPPEWLRHIAAIYERDRPAMIVAPVIYTTDNTAVQNFQLIDFMSMQGITAASYQLRLGGMSNGANLAFTREAYDSVGGYTGTEHLATGDDYLLMMKVNRAIPGRIAYLRSPRAVVTTAPEPTWSSFLQQRIRWASKSGKYPDRRLTAILLLVYLFNLAFPVLIVAGFFNVVYLEWAAVMLIIKIAAELVFLLPVARFFRRQHVLKHFPLLQPLHIAYIVLAGFLGFAGVYKWKGRSVR